MSNRATVITTLHPGDYFFTPSGQCWRIDKNGVPRRSRKKPIVLKAVAGSSADLSNLRDSGSSTVAASFSLPEVMARIEALEQRLAEMGSEPPEEE